MVYAYLSWSLLLLLIWAVLFIERKDLRKKMVFSSLLGLPFALTEFLFVPEYWNPVTLFNFSSRFGIDIESFIWIFSVVGIASVLYEVVFDVHMKKGNHIKKSFAFSAYSGLVALVVLEIIIKEMGHKSSMHFLLGLMSVVGAVILAYRPDLFREAFIGGVLVLFLYMFSLLWIDFIFKDFISSWNPAGMWGVFFFGVPVEELIFAFVLGVIWGPVYEEFEGYRLRRHGRKDKD